MQGVAHFISGIQQGGLELNLSLLLLCLGLFQTGNVGTAIEQGLRQRTDDGSQQFARVDDTCTGVIGPASRTAQCNLRVESGTGAIGVIVVGSQ